MAKVQMHVYKVPLLFSAFPFICFAEIVIVHSVGYSKILSNLSFIAGIFALKILTPISIVYALQHSYCN